MTSLQRLIPTMFHRRLLLLLVLIVGATAVLAARLSVLTVVKAEGLRAAAEARLESFQWLPTIRGRILDRNGRVLAQDRPTFDLAVHYRVISGEWAEDRALAAARRLNRGTWRDMDAEERRALVDRYAPLYRDHLERAWGTISAVSGVSRADVEARRAAVIKRVETLAEGIKGVRERRAINKALDRGEEMTPELEEELDRLGRADIEEETTPRVVIPRIADRVGFEFERLAGERIDLTTPKGVLIEKDVPVVPGIDVVSAADREYPFDTVAVTVDRSTFPGPLKSEQPADITVSGVLIHALGWMGRNATREDSLERAAILDADPALKARSSVNVRGLEHDRGRYEADDPVGRFGIEAAREPLLRGLQGVRFRRHDTGEERMIPAEPGRDQVLTIDITLQATIQAIMDSALGLAAVQEWHALPTHTDTGRPLPGTAIGTPLYGSAVVLDLSGEILAMVSTPGFTREALQSEHSQVFDDPFQPWLNRAISGTYPPGSIAKAPVLVAAVTLGKHTLSHPIECTGHLLPNDPNALRCWIFKRSQNDATPHTHTLMLGHPLDAREALMVSCNIYFYTLGRQLGVPGMRQAYEMFGVGRALDLGLARPAHPADEATGYIAREIREKDDAGRLTTRQPAIGEAILMGIGQGPVAWTPLHAADALATLGRGGAHVKPRIFKDEAPVTTDLRLDKEAVRAALDGLSAAVNDAHGTGHTIAIGDHREKIFSTPGVHVWGKTGTADAPWLQHDADGAGPGKPVTIREGDHSWFVVLVGREGGPPKYAIAVMMEYAGSGGKVSGPICNQIIRALVAGGYL